jgi:hypothetical protein
MHDNIIKYYEYGEIMEKVIKSRIITVDEMDNKEFIIKGVGGFFKIIEYAVGGDVYTYPVIYWESDIYSEKDLKIKIVSQKIDCNTYVSYNTEDAEYLGCFNYKERTYFLFKLEGDNNQGYYDNDDNYDNDYYNEEWYDPFSDDGEYYNYKPPQQKKILPPCPLIITEDI